MGGHRCACDSSLGNITTWYFGLPSSSSHALIGGMVGAALASATTVHWSGVLAKVVIPMIVSPLVGFTLGYLVMVGLMWAFHRSTPHRASRLPRRAQIVSASSLALGHGLQDAQKSMGVIVLALVVTGHQDYYHVPFWVIVLCATALAAGTWSGRPADHADTRQADLPPHAHARLRGGDVGVVGAVPDGVRVRRAGVHDPRWVLTFPGAASIAAPAYTVLNLF